MTEVRDHPGYEQLMKAFNEQLTERQARPLGRQRPRRPLAATALTLASIAAGVLLLSGTGSGGRLDLVAQARAALAPVGQMVHLTTTTHMEMRGGAQTEIVGPESEDDALRTTERWSTSKPTRWRIASTVPIVTAHGTSTGPVQLSYGDGVEELYIQSLNTLNITDGVSEDSPRTSLSDGPLGGDPVARIRTMLEAGQLHDAGSGTVSGRAVERLVGNELNSPLRTPHAPWPVEYDVDPETHAPVRFTVEQVGVEVPENTGTLTTVVEVNTYEALPLNESTAPLLSIQPSGSPIVHHSQDDSPEDQEGDEATTQRARHRSGDGRN